MASLPIAVFAFIPVIIEIVSDLLEIHATILLIHCILLSA
jgi:hypothetical protein